ncbi:uncharacterized protein LOC143299846 [Babylonia areolata]|uniref:uncharacterized protein LOC143299846 n=1 Tax=Babylonia areolata TaxID=304850 RepID=UPI003FD54347
MDADSSSKFISSLTKFLQSLCNGYVEFQRGVELCGHIYLSIDTGEKVDYILHEKVNKSDENSVTFVSNSFHAQPLDKTGPKKDVPLKPCVDDRDSDGDDDDDDDDIMIVDHSKDTPGSTNIGTIPSRSAKHGSSNLDNKRTDGSFHQSQSSTNPLSSPQRNRQHSGRPSATVTSQGSHQENINIGNVKLEQLSSDELLSLASQVDGGDSGSNFPDMQGQVGGPGRIGRRAFSDSAGQPVWIKQEPGDDTHGGPDTGWSQSGDGQSDSSNSNSNVYPMMMHQNPAGFPSNPVFPGFSSTSSSPAFARSRPGGSGAANPYANPMPGTSHSMDPAVWRDCFYRGRTSLTWQRLKMDRARHERKKRQNRAAAKRYRDKINSMRGGEQQQQQQQQQAMEAGGDGGKSEGHGGPSAVVTSVWSPLDPMSSVPSSWPQLLSDLTSSLQALPDHVGGGAGV